MPVTPLGAVMGLAGGALLAGFYHHLPAHGGGRNSQGVSAVNVSRPGVARGDSSCTGPGGYYSAQTQAEVHISAQRPPASCRRPGLPRSTRTARSHHGWPRRATVNPSDLAGLLWNMHTTKGPAKTTYPEAILNR